MRRVRSEAMRKSIQTLRFAQTLTCRRSFDGTIVVYDASKKKEGANSYVSCVLEEYQGEEDEEGGKGGRGRKGRRGEEDG